ncbi:MAG: DUF6516 family protein [Methanothrix sp.]|jgi:hypothetical protein|uniref:Uncharacterized protein n=1 Tax=Methanothrix harundinacea TaxID=301375 RepID=A0A101IGA5_9EURY|nr:MAG: Uncharacterized protein XE07_2173 [Methanothrix harundinacea]MCP1393564.1 hypothetical protein [Methanothrix harundinacea]MDD3710652.1 DUF6516 family protein [Methanothrix sp.]
MLKTLELHKGDLVKVFEVLDFKGGDRFYFIKIKAIFVDESELHIREFISSDNVLYSYHWQDKDGSLRIRWDNAPHHPHLNTYPHHKHAPLLEESEEMCLEDVLKEIREKLQK